MRLLVNGKSEPLAIDTPHPEFRWDWHAESDGRKVVWTHYAIEVSKSTSFQNATLEWDTGKRELQEGRLAVSYEGRPLQNHTRYYWRIRVWCHSQRQQGQNSGGDSVKEIDASEFVETSWFETGLLRSPTSNDTTASRSGDDAVIQTSRLPWPQTPLLRRLCYTIGAYSMVNLFFKPLLVLRYIKSMISPPSYSPTIVKTYACRKHLPVRIFFPGSRLPSLESSAPLPLLLTIHGGGFTFGDPTDNEEWNYNFSNRYSSLVIALNYSKAPSNPFPVPQSDLEALVRAVLTDETLKPYIDTTKVGVMGWSAGGTLALGISTLPSLRESLTAVVAMYPATDFSAKTAQKVRTRQYKPALGGARGWTRDLLQDISPLFGWAYVNPGTDTRDPLLSPVYADRQALPKRVWLVGCELDLLAHDAWRLAARLAGRPVPGMEQKVGQEETAPRGELILEGDERFAWEKEVAGGEYRWLLVPDVLHGFDMPLPEMGGELTERKDAAIKTEKLMGMIAEWLWR